jgi:putative cell wall-binding protein
LDHLALNENQISDISLLANFTSLTYLYLSDNQISDISPLEKLTGLRNLLLDDNQIRDISPIANFKNMLNIYLDNNYLDLTDSYTLSIIDELIKQNDTVRYKPQKPIPATGYFTRFSGKNRAVTANAIATQGWPEGSDTVILASGASFADALAAAPLAAHYDAPILLTSSKTTIEDTVLNTIETLKAKNIIIIGGTSSVSKEIFSQLEGLSLKVDRLAGGNRYTTAIEVAKALEADGVEFTSAFLADGTNFPDALSVSPVAGILQQPILFTNKNDTAKVNADTGKYIAASGITEVVVIGGGISDAAVADLGVENTSRLSGANRYATAVAINTEYKSIFTGDAVTLTTGTNFPDALAGSAFSAKIGAPLFLVGGALSADVKAAIGGFNADEFYVYGGGSSLPDRLVLGHIF